MSLQAEPKYESKFLCNKVSFTDTINIDAVTYTHKR